MLACLAMLAVLMSGASVFAYRSAQQRNTLETLQDRTQVLLGASADLKVAILNATRGERGFVVTQDQRFLEPYTAAQPKIAAEIRRLRALTSSDSEGAAHVRNIESQLNTLAEWQQQVIRLQKKRHA